MSELLQRAVLALKERPVLFKYCTEEVTTSRHNALFQRFITALARGGPGGLPRPIELHAHDPQRYVGDMLAWVHQALAGEQEFVAALLGEKAQAQGGCSLGWVTVRVRVYKAQGQCWWFLGCRPICVLLWRVSICLMPCNNLQFKN